jgi:hypothetical protein
MREIKYTTRFKRDYKREKSGGYGRKLDSWLMEVVRKSQMKVKSVVEWPGRK